MNLKIKERLPYQKDVDRIVRIMKGKGYLITDEDAYKIWLDYSERVSANWLILPDSDEDLINIILANSKLEGN